MLQLTRNTIACILLSMLCQFARATRKPLKRGHQSAATWQARQPVCSFPLAAEDYNPLIPMLDMLELYE
jgi:hypothetical protein